MRRILRYQDRGESAAWEIDVGRRHLSRKEKESMKFLAKSLGSTVFSLVGGWLGAFAGFEASLVLSLIFSVMGWYGTKYLLNRYLD